MAERWGIGDDALREIAVSEASDQELFELVQSIDDIDDEDLYGWLAGPASYDTRPSDEYVALTCLTLAIDSAKLKLIPQGCLPGRER